MRYLILLKGTQPATPPPPALMEAIMNLGAEATASGALLDNGGLAPSAAGALVQLTGGHLSVVDGPFAEAKEFISYALYQVRSKEEAVQWASRFMQLHLDLWPGWEGESDRAQGLRPGGLRATGLTRPCGSASHNGTADRHNRAHGSSQPDGRHTCGVVASHGGCGDVPVRGRGRRPVRPVRGSIAVHRAMPRRRRRPRTPRARRAVEAVWRIESARLIAGLARVTGDVGLAEELAQDALVTALEQWPRTGIPPNPAGWLMTTAKNRAIDTYRRRAMHDRKIQAIGHAMPAGHDPIVTEIDDALDDHIGDDLLRLIFTAAHPVLSTEARVALTLRCLGGLSTEEIARAFLVPTPTAAARIVRAKRTLAAHSIAFELPDPRPAGRAARVGAGGHLPDLQRGLLGHRG